MIFITFQVQYLIQREFSTLIGKSWKTHPEKFPNFSFPGHEPDRMAEKLIHQNFMSTYSVFVKYRVKSKTL